MGYLAKYSEGRAGRHRARDREAAGRRRETAQAGVPCGSWMPFGVAFDDPVGVLPSMVGTTFMAFNRDPATQGLTDRVDRTSDLMSNIYNGFEVSIQARLPNGGTLFGGWTAHQHISNTCDLDNPNGVGLAEFIDINRNRIQGGRFCDQSEIGIPIRNDFKMFGAYPLPGDFEVSGSFQAYSGNEREVRWQIPASYYPGGQRTESASVQLRPPGTDYFEPSSGPSPACRRIHRAACSWSLTTRRRRGRWRGRESRRVPGRSRVRRNGSTRRGRAFTCIRRRTAAGRSKRSR